MGVIEEGSISGYIPSNEAFSVHYPAYPSSTARAIETLGGTQAIRKMHKKVWIAAGDIILVSLHDYQDDKADVILKYMPDEARLLKAYGELPENTRLNEGIAGGLDEKARSSQSNKLELHFRPEDPYSHPAFGELQPCNNLLLRISKKKSTDGQSAEVSSKVSKSQISGEVPIRLCADIIARVSEAYHFNGMVDYQHVLPVHADVARRKKRNWAEVEPHLEKGDLVDVDQEDLMILLPPLFSPKDVPEKLVLRPSMTLNLKKKQEGVVQQRWEMGIEPCLAIDFEIKDILIIYMCITSHMTSFSRIPLKLLVTPLIPKKVNWEQYIPKGSEQWEWQMAVSNLFDERPIWPKGALTERLLDKGLNVGDYTLRRLLFRTAYYFSNGPFLRFWIRKGYDPRKNPDSCIYQRIDFRVPPSLRSYCDANAANGLKQRWEDICSFRVFPYKCHTSLQLFELADDYIQQEIRKPLKQTTCTGATGWFSYRVLESLRLCVMVRFLSICPETSAEYLLKSASDRFEKSKRMHIYENNLRPNEEGIQEVNKELEGDKDKEEPNDVDDDEEDEMEAENGEEELDAYEALDMVGEDDEDSLQSRSYLDAENISRDYLQGLFGSFSFTKAGGGEVQDADTSDGEYQIYEQDSLGEYSDDDDY
uniref:S1-like domain-containing protein n=1 Tax=Vitis vinifera TaxID=29760 RepID=F6HB40_VITVI